jgi:glycosyltransferase involved in cell wall biosynthesis
MTQQHNLTTYNRHSILESLLKTSDKFFTESITVPEALVAIWAADGYPFQIAHDIATPEGVESLVYWWWKHGQYERPSLRSQICDYFLARFHVLSEHSSIAESLYKPTLLMSFIYKHRPDLIYEFPDLSCPEQLSAFWTWWMRCGADEYSLPIEGLPLNIIESVEIVNNDIHGLFSKFLKLVHGVRADLRTLYDINTLAGVESLTQWWWEHGQNEYPNLRDSVKNHFIKQFDKDNYTEALKRTGVLTSPSFQEDIPSFIRDKKTDFKVSVIGYPTGQFGIGEDSRLLADSLSYVGLGHDIYRSARSINAKEIFSPLYQSIHQYEKNSSLNIFCMPAFDTLALLFDVGVKPFENTVNIGFWQWELSRFPEEAKAAFDLVHEVWTISNFAAESLAKSTNKVVRVIPLPVKEFTPANLGRADFGIPIDSFMFFFAFDGSSFISRKNPLGVIEAFQRAFPKHHKDVVLVIKTMGIGNNLLWKECMRKAFADPRIILFDEVMEKGKLLALMKSCNTVISLHRSEGFGRLMAEAFLLEKPVIVSNYSGNLDYTNDSNSYLVDGSLVPVFKEDYPFSKGQVWFEPDLDYAAEILRSVVSEESEATKKAKNGRITILENYSVEACGNAVLGHINQLIKV